MNVSPRASENLRSIFSYIGLGVFCIFSLQMAWTGFVSSDDAYYVQAGLGWLEQFPYVAQNFGTIRASVAIPIAFMIYLFGESEFSVTLSTALFLAATATVTLFMLSSLVGRVAALIASVTLVTIPLFALKATIPCADLPELFFVTLSFWLFWQACATEKRIYLLLISGASAGLAFSAHELTTALLLFYTLLFVRAYRISRRDYLWMALGFAFVLGIEAVYYWIAAGNPIYRFNLLLKATAVHDRIHVGFLEIAGGGTLHIWEPIDPLVMLITHHDFGLLGWVSIPAIWWLWENRNDRPSNAVSLARLILGLGVTWYVVSALLLREMILLPRYYMVTAYCLLIASTVWASTELWPQRKRIAVVMLALALIANMLSISMDNKNPRFAERALVAYLKQSEGTVYTDPLTAHNAYWYCRWGRVDCKRVNAGFPSFGALYFWNPKATSNPNRFMKNSQLAFYQPGPKWEDVLSVEERPRQIVTFLQWSGVGSYVPATVWNRLSHPNPTVNFYIVH